MKKICFILSFLICAFASFANDVDTIPVITRSNSQIYVKDQRVKGGLNFVSPTYYDTTDANVAGNIGNNYEGSLIYTTSDQKFWVRKTWWTEVGAGGGGSGTVTNIATGLGLSGGPITTTGTILVDTADASILSRQRAALTYAPISINGTVTNVSRTNGLGITASVSNPTTTPDITIAVDTSNASILSRQRAAATYQPIGSYVTGNIYTIDGTIGSNRTVDLDGKLVSFQQGGQNFLSIDPTANAEQSLLQSYNTTAGDNTSKVQLNTTDVQSEALIQGIFDGGSKDFSISGSVNSGGSSIGISADVINYTGDNQSFLVGGDSYISLSSNNATFRAYNPTGAGNFGRFNGSVDATDAYAKLESDFNDGVKNALIQTHANTSQSDITYTADTHTFYGNVLVNGTFQVSDTASYLTNVAANYTARSFTDKNYVDSSIAAASSGVTSVSGTSNRITSTGGSTPVIDIAATYVGQTSITTLGTVTTGTLSTGAVIGGVTMTLGSDAAYDVYYRDGSGVLTRLANGTDNQVLTSHTASAPTWETASGGSSLFPTTGTGTATGAVIGDLDGNDLTISNGGTITYTAGTHTFNGNYALTYINSANSEIWLNVNPNSGNGSIDLNAPNAADDGISAIHIRNTDDNPAKIELSIKNSVGVETSDITLNDGTITYTADTHTLVGAVNVTGNLTPTTDDTYSLGDATHRWSDLHVMGTTLHIYGSSSGDISIGTQAAAGTYNFNLPTSAGSSGQPLLSGGGGGSAMTFGTLGTGAGGTGLTGGTSGGINYWSSASTMASSGALAANAVVAGGGAGNAPITTSTATAMTSTNATGTGFVPAVMYTRNTGSNSMSDVNTVQPVFGSSGDVITLQASTLYYFTGRYYLQHGATSHSVGMSWELAGGASLTSIAYDVMCEVTVANTNTASQTQTNVTQATNTTVNGAGSNAQETIFFSGVMAVNAGGTVTPSITFSAAPGGAPTSAINSYVMFWPIGTNTQATQGPVN